MSSIEFEVVLHPDPLLHRRVLLSGVVAMLIGALLIISLPLAISWRAFLAAIWLAESLRELRQLCYGNCRVRSISLASSGRITATSPSGTTHSMTLHTGSLVLGSLAWLRLRFDNGDVFAGLFSRHQVGAEDWHRLQLLWHQSRTSFGHPPGP